jgi:hypothetical protein
MTVSFTDSPEDLIAMALAWEVEAHRPLETRRLLDSLVGELRKARGSQAGSASVLREINIAYGQLEARNAELSAQLSSVRDELTLYRMPVGERLTTEAAVRLNALVQRAKSAWTGR